MQTVIKPQFAFVDVEDTAPVLTSYVDTDDLREVLEAYYQDTLDNPPEDLSRVFYKDLREWHTNSLFGQIDSTMLRKALYSLSERDRSIIEHYYIPDPELESVIQSHYYFSDLDIRFSDYCTEILTDAIQALADIVHGLL